ncbi:MAG: class I SAM-dependent methyltransferase family protein [Crenarchaeota archaeon]|nr:class I SAM-dependent methyltransferase family protein [Thermoproteota archaeon]
MPERSKKSFCITVNKKNGQQTIALINKLGICDKTLQIKKGPKDKLYIPLTKEPTNEDITQLNLVISEFQLDTQVFLQKGRQEKTLADLLKNDIPKNLIEKIPRALDVIGDIAIVEIPAELELYKNSIGMAILKVHPNLHTAFSKIGAINGVFRLRDIEFLVGNNTSTTLHKEYGCTYHIDVAKVYFSPRLSQEHWRISSLVKNGETVIDLFAGVGPFVIPIAKKFPDVKIYAIDINPDAVEYLKINMKINKIKDQIVPIIGDSRKIVKEKFFGLADRVIMNLPETAYDFIDVACKAIKSAGGVIHFYGFIRLPDTIEAYQQRFREAVECNNRKVVKFDFVKPIRETAPYEWQVVLDAQII